MSKIAHHEHELTRKEMKGPDKFQVAAGQAASWAAGHGRQILLAAAAALLLVIVIAGVLAWRDSKRNQAGGALYRALVVAGGEVSSVPLPGVPGPFYASEADKQKAVAEAARRVRESHGATPAADTATLVEADARFHLGEWDAAMAGYRAFLDRVPGDDTLRFAALEGVARVHEAKNELGEAAKAWEKVGESKAHADRAALERARVLARGGQVDEARKILGGFAEQFKESPLRGEAAAQLARLGK